MSWLSKNVMRDILVGVAMAVLVIVLVPLSLIHDVWYGRRRRGGGERPIPRVRAADTSIASLLRVGRPVVVEGLAERIGAPRADVSGLRDLARSNTLTFTVEFFNRANPYFLYTGDYGATAAHHDQLSLAELLDAMFETGTGDTVVYQLLGPGAVDGAIGEVIDEFGRCVRTDSGRPIVRHASGVWIGSSGVVTPLHHDSWPGLLFQTEGRKAVTMFSPRDRPHLYFNFPLPVGSRWSRLPGRSCEADAASYPRFARATRLTAVLEPGDVLFIPPFWAHEMQALEANVSVPLRLQPYRSDYLDPGFLRPAAEVIHARLGKVAAARRVTSPGRAADRLAHQ